MKYDIEAEGNRVHWVVRCVSKGGKVEAVHRFYRSLDGFIYHRGKHDEHELPAQEALTEYLKANPGATSHLEGLEPGEHSTMHVRQIAAGGAKRD